MKTIKQLKPKLRFINNTIQPILGNVLVTSDALICHDLETFVKIKDNYNMLPGLQDYHTLGLVDSNEDIGEYPIVDFTIDKTFEVDTKTRVLEELLDYASDDETRPFLCGIAINEGHLVATNGYIMKSFKIDIDKDCSYIMPASSVKVLVKLLKGFKFKNITLQVSDDYIMIDNDRFTLKMRLIQREYPKWQNIIPKKFTKSFQVDNWIDYKEIKTLFSRTKKTCSIKTIEGNIVLIPRNYPNNQYVIGKVEEEFEFGFNIEFLEVASNGEKSFKVEYNSELAPFLVNGAIVMPLKL